MHFCPYSLHVQIYNYQHKGTCDFGLELMS